jgi:hypothetical protein
MCSKSILVFLKMFRPSGSLRDLDALAGMALLIFDDKLVSADTLPVCS